MIEKPLTVRVTTNSLCDLPMKTLREYHIDTIPFRILSDGKEYYDGFETDPGEIVRYMKAGKDFVSEPPTEDEFIRFFDEELKLANQIVYISVAKGISREYDLACKAAKKYGNVYVFNSGYNSSSIGMLVLFAQSLLLQGCTLEVVLSELENVKKSVHCSFITMDPGVLLKRGVVGKGTYGLMKAIGLRPIVGVENNNIKIHKIFIGKAEKSYEKYIEHALPKKGKPDPDLAFITYVDIPEDIRELIAKKIRSIVPFKKIVFQRASGVLALSCGPGAFGILYLDRREEPYNLDGMLFDEKADEEYEGDELYNHEAYVEDRAQDTGKTVDDSNEASDYDKKESTSQDSPSDYAQKEGTNQDSPSDYEEKNSTDTGKWYENIEGIDSKAALENSGSEESLREVLGIFYKSLSVKADELEGFFENEDWKNYTIKVHALKSSAMVVGAHQLAENARNLEMAGKADDTDFIKAHHLALLDELILYEEILSRIYDVSE